MSKFLAVCEGMKAGEIMAQQIADLQRLLESTQATLFAANTAQESAERRLAEREAVLQKSYSVLQTHYRVSAQINAEATLDLQRQLAEAIRERDQYKAACEMADALRPLGAVQVVEGGAAVLLDTSKGAT